MLKSVLRKISIYSMLSSLAITSYTMFLKIILDGVSYKANVLELALALCVCTASFMLACLILDSKKDL